eukprot:gnl/TRDRNA2_/TRDRNA2_145584_c2_seq1.p1 gnl/TRDRNA2_/TRDRNA2_145584_c2~~gnl/TRDRNA2_/TRDRNA2_145584_c2_seq1.p1  ORF type:complete len:197 (-),score=21.63 gnl/TRDRNA2_/TRDRNA2_145584_c2_seq1:301-849(-)
MTETADEAAAGMGAPVSSTSRRRQSVFSMHSIGSELLGSQVASKAPGGSVQPQVSSVYEKGMWLDDLCLFKDVVRIKTIVSLVDSELLVVSRSNLLKLRDRFPEMAEYYDQVQQRVLAGGLAGAGFVCIACLRPGHSIRNCPCTTAKKAPVSAAEGKRPRSISSYLAMSKLSYSLRDYVGNR